MANIRKYSKTYEQWIGENGFQDSPELPVANPDVLPESSSIWKQRPEEEAEFLNWISTQKLGDILTEKETLAFNKFIGGLNIVLIAQEMSLTKQRISKLIQTASHKIKTKYEKENQ